MVEQPRQEYGEGVESQADLSARHDLVDAVIEQANHVKYGEESSTSDYDSWAIEDEVEELGIFRVCTGIFFVNILGDVGNYENS